MYEKPFEVVTNTNMQYESHIHQAMVLFRDKNAEYDGAFKKYGFMGVVYEILGVLNRIPPMTIWHQDQGRSKRAKLRDLFLDLINYSVMALICMEESNWDGRKEDLVPLQKGDTHG